MAVEDLLSGEVKSNWIMADSGAAVTAGIKGLLGANVPHGTGGQPFI